ncbi:MAG: hypothetical protein ACR2PJ_03380, partial [Pseudomonadales bacterium]
MNASVSGAGSDGAVGLEGGAVGLKSFEPAGDSFKPAVRGSDAPQIARPSLSYWQDAWARLRKNNRAILSLGIIVLLGFFTLLGPVVWGVDPGLQDLGQVSQPPSLPKSALVAAPYTGFQKISLDEVPEEPDEYPSSLPAPEGLRVLGQATTQRVRLAWAPVASAGGYNIYRNNRQPEGFNDLGLPLGSTYPEDISYE